MRSPVKKLAEILEAYRGSDSEDVRELIDRLDRDVLKTGLKVGFLDGSVELTEHWGSDALIVQSARESTTRMFKGFGTRCARCGEYFESVTTRSECRHGGAHAFVRGDERLLEKLGRSSPPHTSPFENAGAIIHAKAPRMVFNHVIRHRTGSYNVYSRRYSSGEMDYYVPSTKRLMAIELKNKQAQGNGQAVTEEVANDFIQRLEALYRMHDDFYAFAVESGIARELARLGQPDGSYVSFSMSMNLLNWMKFLKLRDHPDAQWETQEFARAVKRILIELFPRSIDAFMGEA